MAKIIASEKAQIEDILEACKMGYLGSSIARQLALAS